MNYNEKLNDFDLNEYIKAIHFDELKVPTVVFRLPTSKAYFGLKDMMASELNFLKVTVLSKSMEPVIMYSDMPMEEMLKDPDFPKKWMFGMAMMIKKWHRILDYADEQRKMIEEILKNEIIEDGIPMLSKEEFESYPAMLSLAGLFFEKDINYSYDEYVQHIRQSEEFEKNHPNYRLTKTSVCAFRNLQIQIHEGKWTMVSKEKSPAIHFVIHHPKLRGAIEKFVPPIVEK